MATKSINPVPIATAPVPIATAPVPIATAPVPIATLPDEILVKIFGNLDIIDLVRMSGASRGSNVVANDPTLWKNIASQIDLQVLDNATVDDIKQQLQRMHDIAATNGIVSGPIIIENLQEALIIQCRDILKVWQKIIETSGIPFAIPSEIRSVRNPESLDKMLGDWIESNRDQLDHLTMLDLESLNLQFLPPSIGKLSNLEDLNLSHNQLVALPDSLGNLRNLRTLDLSHNQLVALPDSFGNLTKLVILDLSHNQLVALPDSFGNLTDLLTLDLDNNRLVALPDSFGNIRNLTFLNLSHNQLPVLPDSFRNLTNLERLDLSHNQLPVLPDSFRNLINLESYSLDNNLFVLDDMLFSNLRREPIIRSQNYFFRKFCIIVVPAIIAIASVAFHSLYYNISQE